MTAKVPIHKVAELSTDPEKAAGQRRDAEPIEDPVPAEAEEEEMEELWAHDPGNQGA